MQLGQLRIQNYRAVRDVTAALTNFVCLIGENNAGKSSVLQALILLHSGSPINSTNFFDPAQDVCIELTLDAITEVDLNRLHAEHRERIREIIRNGKLRLVRRYNTEGKSRLRFMARVPNEARFSDNAVDSLVAGQRPGAPFVLRVSAAFPELSERITPQMNQGQVKQLIAEFAGSLPPDRLIDAERDLPTGFDKSISALLPEPIYIPAVKDFADDVKTKESTPFGRILGILLEQIEGQLSDAGRWFAELNQRLNRVVDPQGRETDARLAEVREIESLVESYVAQTFGNIKLRLEIPPPEIKAILSGARIFANDGVEGLLESKGDGLRRAVVFSILRTYVEMRRRLAARQAATGAAEAIPPAPAGRYLLLFEEPELYLHPTAQKILFDALTEFSRDNSVVVTTHSPAFFGPDATKTFVKVRKALAAGVSKPFTTLLPITLTGVRERDQFQIICYENNNSAFFGDVVVLVEGPSDFLVLPHVARTLNPEWTASRNPVRFARIGGKCNISKYRQFFRRFGTRTIVISDLDLLINDFSQIDPTDELMALRSELLTEADQILATAGVDRAMNEERARDAQERGTLRALWRRAREELASASAHGAAPEESLATLEEFFAYERKDARLDIFAHETANTFVQRKRNLLARLREQDVFVLERGAIEAYYPADVPQGDKLARAQQFCNIVTTREAMVGCCSSLTLPDSTQATEFEVIFREVFRGVDPG